MIETEWVHKENPESDIGFAKVWLHCPECDFKLVLPALVRDGEEPMVLVSIVHGDKHTVIDAR